MKNYDMNIDWGMAKIKVTLQFENYTGYYIHENGGNVKGFELIEGACDTEIFEASDIKESNCSMEINDEEGWFSCELKDEEGNTCGITGELSELKDYIVAAEIIEFKEDPLM